MRGEELKERIERVDVKRLLRWLRRAPGDLVRGTPDWSYIHDGLRWQVEVTSAAIDPAELRQLYVQRLEDDPASWTTPSTSDGSLRGISLASEFVLNEAALAASIRDALAKKSLMRYGNLTRTHLLIDASGRRVQGVLAVYRIAGLCRVPADYPPYAGVVAVFAIEDWERPLIALQRGA